MQAQPMRAATVSSLLMMRSPRKVLAGFFATSSTGPRSVLTPTSLSATAIRSNWDRAAASSSFSPRAWADRSLFCQRKRVTLPPSTSMLMRGGMGPAIWARMSFVSLAQRSKPPSLSPRLMLAP